MTIQELFIAANEALKQSVSQIGGEQWELAMPPGTSTKPTNLRDAVRYNTYDDAWVPDVLTGKTTKQVGDTYDHLKTDETDVRATYDRYNQRASDAVRQFGELTRTTHLSYGDFPARDYLQHITIFRAFRSYDIAKLIGADTTMDPAMVQALTDELNPVVESYRQLGVFPPAIKVADDASPQAKLLGMVGRE